MTITRYTRRSPFHSTWGDLEDMTNRINRFLGESANGETLARFNWNPAVNVEETKDGLLLSAELPGMAIGDIEIEVENNVLSLKGEKKEEREEKEERRYHLWERSYGSFHRSFTLPRTVKAEEISAHFKDGILHIRMPKVPEAKSRKITVDSEARGVTS